MGYEEEVERPMKSKKMEWKMTRRKRGMIRRTGRERTAYRSTAGDSIYSPFCDEILADGEDLFGGVAGAGGGVALHHQQGLVALLNPRRLHLEGGTRRRFRRHSLELTLSLGLSLSLSRDDSDATNQ